MDIKRKILLSSVAAMAALSFTACGDSSSSSTPTTTPDDNETVVTPSTFTGDGKDDAYERFTANDAAFTMPTAHAGPALADIKADQVAIKALADSRGAADTTTLAAGTITTDVTLSKDTVYEIGGLVKIADGATLTIPAGTILYGDDVNNGYIVVLQGGQIIAEGTEDEPIVFTSKAALTDATTADQGQWGGLTLLGKATTNQQNPVYEIDENDPDFAFGGTVDNDNSGSLKHVMILNSGVVVGTDQEINGLSLCGVGSGTTIENIHVENSEDDGVEAWGGTVNMTNLTIIGALDDSLDLDFGYSGTVTNVVVEQTEAAHAGFEISSGGNAPMTEAKIVNFTINKFDGSDEGGIYIKDDTTAPTFVNGFVTTNGTDGVVNTRRVMTTEQKSTIEFKDVNVRQAQ